MWKKLRRVLGLLASTALNWLSGEWMLREHANGGGVILFRALWISAFAFVVSLGIYDFLRPSAELSFDPSRLRCLAHSKFEWFGALFGAAYAALYARFSAQWAYLAGLYNSIVQTSTSLDPTSADARQKLGVWWAAFIEDADELHLARKPIFASVIRQLLKDPQWSDVRANFVRYTPDGRARLRRIRLAVETEWLLRRK